MSVVDPGSEAGHHHHPTGHRWLDIMLGVSAFIISLVSLFLALQHGRVMEKMVEATTWPYVMADFSTANPDGSLHVTLQMVNKGVGPARVESLEVFYQDAPVEDTQALLRTILSSTDPSRRWPLVRSDVINSVLSPKETVTLVDLDPKSFTSEEYTRISDAFGKLMFRTCYCSVFKECWVLDTRSAPWPVEAKSCSVPERMFKH